MKRKSIRAEITLDEIDHVVVEFNAAPWFEQASKEQILSLAFENWKHGYTADATARMTADSGNRDVGTLLAFDELRSRTSCGGYEVEVNRADALLWIEDRYPGWVASERLLHEEEER